MSKIQRIKMVLTTLVIILRHPIDAYWLMKVDVAGELIELYLWKAAHISYEEEQAIWDAEEAADYWTYVWETIYNERLSNYGRIEMQVKGSALRMDHEWYMHLGDKVRKAFNKEDVSKH